MSKEPGFVSFELSRARRHKLPQRTPGLLAFVHSEDGKEKVLRFLLCDDLVKAFTESRPFCREANEVSYHPFPSSQSGDWVQYQNELETRLRVFARLFEKYDPPQKRSGS